VQVTVLIYDSSSTNTYHIVKDAPIPVGSALKVVSGQKIVLNGDDKVQVYASAATVDVVASILQDVT
jgi:ribosomal protein L6P/L9E